MKLKIALICSMFLTICSLNSCNKSNFNYPAGTVGISKIVYFAQLSLKGSPYMSVVEGQEFADPGCTAEAGGDSLAVTVNGSVNSSQVGIYVLTYTAVNAQGFPASVTRTVAVLPSAEPAGVDISGSYYYVATGGNNSTVTKVAPGFYSATNCWDSQTIIPILFICVDGTNIIIPNQTTGFGPIAGTGTLTASGALTYIVSLSNYGIVNSARYWQLQ
jgi:hypothetical protein